tara:strand:- start:492 stop:842 length:351 start_codon:yes stop_codon:yes gene_type:complete
MKVAEVKKRISKMNDDDDLFIPVIMDYQDYCSLFDYEENVIDESVWKAGMLTYGVHELESAKVIPYFSVMMFEFHRGHWCEEKVEADSIIGAYMQVLEKLEGFIETRKKKIGVENE